MLFLSLVNFNACYPLALIHYVAVKMSQIRLTSKKKNLVIAYSMAPFVLFCYDDLLFSATS